MRFSGCWSAQESDTGAAQNDWQPPFPSYPRLLGWELYVKEQIDGSKSHARGRLADHPDPRLSATSRAARTFEPGEVLCDHCAAKCCRYFALPIDKPKEWEDFDYIRWYLLHERAAVFVEEDCWYLLVQNRCKHLRDDHLCDIYDTRPQICRDYTTAELRVRRRLGLRPLLGNAGAGRGIRRGRARPARGESRSAVRSRKRLSQSLAP